MVMATISDYARRGVQGVISWAFNDAMAQMAMPQGATWDCYIRAAYNNDFRTLFPRYSPGRGKEDLLIPDMTIRHVVRKIAVNIFPNGTTFTLQNDKANEVFQQLLKDMKMNRKLPQICTEAALMGYVGIRTVWVEEAKQWVTEIKCKECLVIETDPLAPDRIIAISVSHPVYKDGRRYWYKERWTKDFYYTWPLLPISAWVDKEPKDEFKIEKAISQPNTYQEIPISIVTHAYDQEFIGCGVVRHDDVLMAKALIRIKNKRHFTHLEHMDPTLVRKNHSKPGEPPNRGVNAVIDLQDSGSDRQADAFLLEMSGVADSVIAEIDDYVDDFYKNAGLTTPTDEQDVKSGNVPSGVALRIRDHGEADTIEALRDDGYAEVVAHMEKIIRMLARTNQLDGYAALQPESDETRKVTVKYPDFFPATDQDILTKLTVLQLSNLPPSERAKMEAQAFSIEDEKIILEIEQEIVDKKKQAEPGTLKPNGPA